MGGRYLKAVELLTVGVVFLSIITGVLLWMDNVHFGTMNGVWKSVVVENWKSDPSSASLDPSNYLYYPLAGLLCRVLDIVGVYSGQAWKQLAIINTLFASLNITIIYAFVRWFTGRREAALASVILALGCGFFLQLATSNEDIMPTFTLFAAPGSPDADQHNDVATDRLGHCRHTFPVYSCQSPPHPCSVALPLCLQHHLLVSGSAWPRWESAGHFSRHREAIRPGPNCLRFHRMGGHRCMEISSVDAPMGRHL